MQKSNELLLAGIDIGGTKTSVCVGTSKGTIIATKRIQTQPLKNWRNGLQTIAQLIQEILQEKDIDLKNIKAIGISSPGPISSKEGKMINPPNLKGWENAPLVQYFKEAFHKPTMMNNDANAAALAEFQFGEFKGVQNLVYLTASTGMGGGAIINGQLVQGVSDTAAEVGHYILERNGPPCPCGLNGCFEAFCGGAALAKRMQKEIAEKKIDTLILKAAKNQIEKIQVDHLIESVRQKDSYALSIWAEFIERLAQGIGVVLMCFNPEVLILGTIAIHAKELLLDPLRARLPHYAWKEPLAACRIEASRLGSQLSELSGLALAQQALDLSHLR